MSETISEFINFIAEDPLMLGLSIAIIVLIILFILVLILGKKDNKEEVTKEEIVEHTAELLKSDIDDAILKSTQEYKVPNLMQDAPVTIQEEKTMKIDVVDNVTEDLAEKEVPISVDEAIALKNTREQNLVKDTIQIPVVEEPTTEAPEVAPVAPIEEKPVAPSFDDVMIKTNQPFSSVNPNNEQVVPNTEVQEDIIKHTEEVKPEVEDDDDFELPKLNTDPNTSIIKTIGNDTANLYK